MSVFIIHSILFSNVSLAQENPGINRPHNIELLSPAIHINTFAFQRITRKMIIDSYAKNSLVGQYNYMVLKFDLTLGAKVNILALEEEFSQQLSLDDIVFFTQERDTEKKLKARLKVKDIFETVLSKYNIEFYSDSNLEQYLQLIMRELRKRLEQKSAVAKEKDFREKAKAMLGKMQVSDIFIYSQHVDSMKKHAIRRKVKSIFEMFARNNNIYFDNYEMWNFLDKIMDELKQEILDKIQKAVRQNERELKDLLNSSLTSQQIRLYLGNNSLLNLKKQDVTNTVNDMFKKWLEGHNVYFDVSYCHSLYTLLLEEAMIAVAQEKAIMKEHIFKIIKAKQVNPASRVKGIFLQQVYLINQAI